MASCDCNRHENIIVSDYYGRGRLLDYREHEQNTIFINVKYTLLIVDITNYIKECAKCKKQREIYTYGTWPDVRVSFDGATDLPIRAIVNNVDFHEVYVDVRNEPSIGNFIYVDYTTCQDYDKCFIIYYPMGNIERSIYGYILVDGKPAVCCQTFEQRNIVLINSEGKVINAKIIYTSICDKAVFKIGNGTLYYDEESGRWKYTANPALKTKPAARE
jgi:hypothetical protein